MTICLKPYLAVEGASFPEAHQKMDRLLRAYIVDAVNDGQLEHFMSRRAPFSVYAEYLLSRLSGLLRQRRYRTFSETGTVPVHA